MLGLRPAGMLLGMGLGHLGIDLCNVLRGTLLHGSHLVKITRGSDSPGKAFRGVACCGIIPPHTSAGTRL